MQRAREKSNSLEWTRSQKKFTGIMVANAQKLAASNCTVNALQTGDNAQVHANAPAATTSLGMKWKFWKQRWWQTIVTLGNFQEFPLGLLFANALARSRCAGRNTVSATVLDCSAQNFASAKTATMDSLTAMKKSLHSQRKTWWWRWKCKLDYILILLIISICLFWTFMMINLRLL